MIRVVKEYLVKHHGENVGGDNAIMVDDNSNVNGMIIREENNINNNGVRILSRNGSQQNVVFHHTIMNGINLQQSQQSQQSQQPQGHYIPTSGQNNIYPTYVANSNKNIINSSGGLTIQQLNVAAMGPVVVPVIRGQ